jgi:hypothetical protein
MIDLLRLIFAVLASLFKSRAELEAENLVLRQQVNVLRPAEAQAARSDKRRSPAVCFGSITGFPPRRTLFRLSDRNSHWLAPRWLTGLLAVEISRPRCWQTQGLT